VKTFSFWRMMVVAAMLASAWTTQAQPTLSSMPDSSAVGTPPGPIDVLNMSEVKPMPASQTPPKERLAIHLQRATFDPLAETPALPANLSLSAYPGAGEGYYLVQFHGPILPEWKQALQKQGRWYWTMSRSLLTSCGWTAPHPPASPLSTLCGGSDCTSLPSASVLTWT